MATPATVAPEEKQARSMGSERHSARAEQNRSANQSLSSSAAKTARFGGQQSNFKRTCPDGQPSSRSDGKEGKRPAVASYSFPGRSRYEQQVPYPPPNRRRFSVLRYFFHNDDAALQQSSRSVGQPTNSSGVQEGVLRTNKSRTSTTSTAICVDVESPSAPVDDVFVCSPWPASSRHCRDKTNNETISEVKKRPSETRGDVSANGDGTRKGRTRKTPSTKSEGTSSRSSFGFRNPFRSSKKHSSEKRSSSKTSVSSVVVERPPDRGLGERLTTKASASELTAVPVDVSESADTVSELRYSGAFLAISLNADDSTTQTSSTPAKTVDSDESMTANTVADNHCNPALLLCPICLASKPALEFPRLVNCDHRVCLSCYRLYLTIEIGSSRVQLSCMCCSEDLHPTDLYRICSDGGSADGSGHDGDGASDSDDQGNGRTRYGLNLPSLIDRYEMFMLRKVLITEPDVRFCPAPDCRYAVIATGCAPCPRLQCEICRTEFCYHCKAEWHPNQTCDEARAQRNGGSATGADEVVLLSSKEELKPCPRCAIPYAKMNDGSCNHMICPICNAEFCWLCLKEISDLHFLSPSGCTFWGRKPWSRKKKILWHLAILAGAPLCIALAAGITVPAILVGFPIYIGRKLAARHIGNKCARVSVVTGGCLLATATAPLLAAVTVGAGVPLLFAYVYGVIPVSLCQSGAYGVRRSRPSRRAGSNVATLNAAASSSVSNEPSLSMRFGNGIPFNLDELVSNLNVMQSRTAPDTTSVSSEDSCSANGPNGDFSYLDDTMASGSDSAVLAGPSGVPSSSATGRAASSASTTTRSRLDVLQNRLSASLQLNSPTALSSPQPSSQTNRFNTDRASAEPSIGDATSILAATGHMDDSSYSFDQLTNNGLGQHSSLYCYQGTNGTQCGCEADDHNGVVGESVLSSALTSQTTTDRCAGARAAGQGGAVVTVNSEPSSPAPLLLRVAPAPATRSSGKLSHSGGGGGSGSGGGSSNKSSSWRTAWGSSSSSSRKQQSQQRRSATTTSRGNGNSVAVGASSSSSKNASRAASAKNISYGRSGRLASAGNNGQSPVAERDSVRFVVNPVEVRPAERHSSSRTPAGQGRKASVDSSFAQSDVISDDRSCSPIVPASQLALSGIQEVLSNIGDHETASQRALAGASLTGSLCGGSVLSVASDFYSTTAASNAFTTNGPNGGTGGGGDAVAPSSARPGLTTYAADVAGVSIASDVSMHVAKMSASFDDACRNGHGDGNGASSGGGNGYDDGRSLGAFSGNLCPSLRSAMGASLRAHTSLDETSFSVGGLSGDGALDDGDDSAIIVDEAVSCATGNGPGIMNISEERPAEVLLAAGGTDDSRSADLLNEDGSSVRGLAGSISGVDSAVNSSISRRNTDTSMSK